MNKKIFFVPLVALLALTGCEVPKKEVMKKHYNLIVHNVDSFACSSIVIGYVADDHGYSDVNFHQDSNSAVTCSDYGKFKGDDCEVADLKSVDEGYGEYSCVLGTDKKPTKGDLASSYKDSIDLESEARANK